jgi:PAT family beta-lactamase induction signal transducer AmpG
MATSITLADSSRVRYATGAIMYFAQGIPQGLLAIAIPAWLASQGVSPTDIGSYLAVIVLPWAFKLVTGPLMDRYEFLPMGRRRPWVIGAQLGLSLSLLALMLVERPAEQVGLLMLIGVLINSFAATQDVAVDGMSIDMTPVREQGRLNAFMSFGKAVGWGLTAAVSGLLLVTWGLQATAILASAVAGVALLAIVFVREREGERSLPWSGGKAATTRQPGKSFGAVLGGLNKVLWARTSVIVLIIMFFDGLVYGYGQALMPIAAIKLFGYTTPQWSQLVAVMGLTGAVLALALGPLIDRFGAKRMLIFTIALVGVHAFLLAQTQYLWQNTTYVRVMLSIWIMMLPVVMVSSIALAMAVCSSSISATQFAIYMSVANLGHSVGSKVYGMVAERSTYVETYTLLSLFVIAMIVVLVFHRHRIEETTRQGTRQKAAPRYTIALGGGDAGLYWSGAMRCPKCRADMDQVVYEGTEVDRCTRCNGIWFDAGEIERLKSKKAAAAIDTGDTKTGMHNNTIDRYRCPRCSGVMTRMVDPKQRHIWYETCGSCHGSFFDAGEFRDLSDLTVVDFFKSLSAPERG